MSTFICEKCGCIDNSACKNNYWIVKAKLNIFSEEYYNTHLVCTSCAPKEKEFGEWNNKFRKRHWSECGTKEKLIAMCKENNGNLVNAIEYFKKYEGE